MARKTKTGLTYFPLEVDFHEDDKFRFLTARFGIKGEYIAIRLLARIYKEKGYYTDWNDDISLLFATRVGDGVTHALVNDVVKELLKRDFFDKGLFERFRILTSKGIQERYSKICTDAKRKNWEIDKKYDLLEITPEFKDKTPEFITKTQEEILQSKVKKSKVKKSIYSALESEAVTWDEVVKYLNFYDWIMENASRVMDMEKPITVKEYHKLVADGYSKDLIASTAIDMENKKDLTTRYQSANLTIRKWMERRKNDAKAENPEDTSPATKEMLNQLKQAD